jgi:hypothetical protein
LAYCTDDFCFFVQVIWNVYVYPCHLFVTLY